MPKKTLKSGAWPPSPCSPLAWPPRVATAQTAPTKTTTTTTKVKPTSTTTTTTTMKTPAGGMPANEQFTTPDAAQASCPTDKVVWLSFTSTKSFHMSTSKYFGKTKHGAYACQQAALAAGYHQAKT